MITTRSVDNFATDKHSAALPATITAHYWWDACLRHSVAKCLVRRNIGQETQAAQSELLWQENDSP
jgi:hypothetical protein